MFGLGGVDTQPKVAAFQVRCVGRLSFLKKLIYIEQNVTALSPEELELPRAVSPKKMLRIVSQWFIKPCTCSERAVRYSFDILF